ncbi:unnamed protein product [Cuscuta epithymum]|uniref:Rapid ALkalinization Factor n=1 Tax=Cuscuta epithymum TaxID=186058 RepID=A0AAV0GM35_9ASTE|nr:unnamed protein product [Cuscuta epithymum]
MANIKGIVFVVCLIGLIACTHLFVSEAATEISNGVLDLDKPSCGHANKNCRPKESQNPYRRGCNAADRCREGDLIINEEEPHAHM